MKNKMIQRISKIFPITMGYEIYGVAWEALDVNIINVEISFYYFLFQHEGETIGKQLKNLLPNPTLARAFNISASVHFEALQVTGSVIVEDMDNLNYGKILEDIIYKVSNLQCQYSWIDQK